MTSENTYSTLTIMKRMFSFFKPYKLFLVLFLFASAISTFIGILQGYLIENIVNLSLRRELISIKFYIVIMITAIIIGAVTTYLQKFLYGYFFSSSMKDFRLTFYKHLQKLPVVFFEENPSGDLLSRFNNDAASVQQFFGQDFISFFIDFFMLIATVIYLSIINWRLLTASIVLTPLALLGINFMANYVKRYSRQNQEFKGRANSVVQDAVNGIGMVKAFNMEGIMCRRYDSEIKSSLKYSLKEITINVLAIPMHVLLRAAPPVICIIYGSYLSIKGFLTPGEFLAFIYLLQYVSWPLAFIFDKVTKIKSTAGASERVLEVLDWEAEREGGKEADSKSKICIEMREVTFGYTKERKILDNFNIRIEKGKKIALVGHSGCGKSTLIKLNCGFQFAESGYIDIFGNNINDMNLHSLRENISLVSQDTYLYPVSIMENIAYGRLDATIDEIIEAAKVANAYEFIMALPQGFQTMVGERGVKLSGGQRQRIALARAALKKAPLLLLDEPTSALDTESEALVQDALDKILKDNTAIIVAHRFSTIKNADEIFVLEHGRIVERGTHDQLVSMGGSYMKLYSKQFSNNKVEVC
ncbi:MAG: ABC transporter ATP-binding protein [Bacillota bacterium]|nr:ABC transporter ATP-binding protein [Bacillota bacterium]